MSRWNSKHFDSAQKLNLCTLLHNKVWLVKVLLWQRKKFLKKVREGFVATCWFYRNIGRDIADCGYILVLASYVECF